MTFPLSKLEETCRELRFDFERVNESRLDITLAAGLLLSFQNCDADDCAAGFLDCPWHFHDSLTVADAEGNCAEYGAEDLLLGLSCGELLVAERRLHGQRQDLWIVGKGRLDPGELDPGEHFSIHRLAEPQPVIPYDPLGVERYKKIVFLTGAGISKASGLPTYRGEGGVWEEKKVEEVGTKEAIERDPVGVWRAYLEMHREVTKAQPNAAHLAIAELQERLGDDCWVCVMTQNVDGLHLQAGTTSVVEAHGSLRRLRCTRCKAKPWEIDFELTEEPPRCRECGAMARFDIVLFNEPVDPTLGLKALAFLGDCELYIVVGTSGLVAPASQLIELAEEAGARTVLIDTEPKDGRFDEIYAGRAEVLLPHLLS